MRTNQATLFDDELPLPRERSPAPAPPRPQFICHEERGTLINQRRSDGYIDATAMCRAHGKRFSNYSQTDTFRDFAEALSVTTGIPVVELVQSREGGSHSGTWVHPRYAIRLAVSLSPTFAVLVTDWVMDWMQGRSPVVSTGSVEPLLVVQLRQQLDRIENNTAATHKRVKRIDRTTTAIQLDFWHKDQLDRAKPIRYPAAVREPVAGDPSTWRPIRR